MFTAKLAAGALAIALLAMSAPSSPSSAAPGVAPEPASVSGIKASAITLVRQGGGRFGSGGGNRGFSAGGNRGFSSGGNRGFSSRGSIGRSIGPRLGGGNRAMRFDRGGSRRFARSHGVPRPGFNINPRYDRGHHRHHHHHRHRHHRFPGVAIYGAAPYVYDYSGDGCEDLYENAVATGSAYWWNRYYDCRDGD